MRQIISLTLLGLLTISCQKINLEEEKKSILAQIEVTSSAHLKKDANQFFQPHAAWWYDIRNGLIDSVAKSSVIGPTQDYLDDMEFDEMIRHHDPIIEVSDDGTLGSYIGAITIKGEFNGNPVYWATSWQSLFRKVDGKWQIVSQMNSDADEYASASILLDQVRGELGFAKDEDYSFSAMADCVGPREEFKTLILSRNSDGRMEQLFGGRHLIIKHGRDTTWTFDLDRKRHLANPRAKMFVSGHELHWLTFRPEARYSRPKLNGVIDYKGQQAFHLEFQDDAGNPVNFYYSFDTYVPIAFDTQISPEGDLVVVEFDNWGQQNGVSVPMRARFTAMGEVFEYTYTDIRLNQLDPEDFESREAMIQGVG